MVYEDVFSKHYCEKCKKIFSCPMDDFVAKGSHFTLLTKRLVLARLHEDLMSVKLIQRQMLRDFNVEIHPQTIYYWKNEKYLSKS